jgi:hypothetical protein
MYSHLNDEGAIMSKTKLAAVAIGLALVGGTAFADDSSMSQWTGDSYKAFEAARKVDAASPKAARVALNAIPDNSTSQFGGDSFLAFQASRATPEFSATTVAEVREPVRPSRDAPVRTATRVRHPLDPFRDDTAG